MFPTYVRPKGFFSNGSADFVTDAGSNPWNRNERTSLRKGLRAGSTKTLKLKLTSRQLKALRKAGTRGKLKLTVSAKDAAGNVVKKLLA